MGQIAELITAVLDGKQSPEALGPCWRADLAMPIYERACKVLEMPRDNRKKAINSHPPAMAKLLADEVKRVYILRRHKPEY